MSARQPFVIQRLEVFNWGPFSGRHVIPIDRRGTAIIGQTGSGKTTLVDALMTLITERPQYNLASTGGHESDRDLLAYIRGKAGEGTGSDNRHMARPKATQTALCACFSDGQSHITLGVLFWMQGTSSALADLKRVWMLGQGPEHNPDQGVAEWLQLLRDPGGLTLKKALREAGMSPHDSKKHYLARVQGLFQVGPNAFPLLNRAAGLKQLNSVDQLFRDLVLENNAAFDQADRVVKDFDTLSAIHQELEIARKQQDSLLPIQEDQKRHEKRQTELRELRQMQRLLPIWFAEHAVRLWQARQDDLETELKQARLNEQAMLAKQKALETDQEERHRIYIEAGGGDIETLKERMERQRVTLTQCRTMLAEYQRLTASQGMDGEVSEQALKRNQALVRERLDALEKQRETLDQERDQAGAMAHLAETERKDLEAQLTAARANPDSNIPEQYLAFKALLAESIQAPADALAYVAELVAVKEEQSDWRGAIERAIGAQRLRLIIPAEHMQPALAWVNQRDNRINIRLLDAGHYAGRQAANFFSDGYTHKLQFAKHPLREAAKHFLAEHDLHCVADTHALHHTEHALTREGMISGRRGRFEKMDARRLNEGWCTGFDNHDLVSQLEEQLLEATRKARQASQQLKQAKQALTEADQQQAMLEALANLEFSRLDVQGAQNTLDYLERQLVELQSPGSKAELARQAWEQAKQASQAHQEKITEQATTLSRLQAEIEYAQRQIKLFLKQRGAGLNEEQRALVERRYRQPETKDLEGIIELQREAEQGLTTPIERAEEDLRRIDNRLVRLMSTAKQLDTGALAEAGTDLEDIPQYLNQLEVLTKEALPAKRERFLSYLNKSSDEGVTQLLTHIDTEVAAIEERIEELNQTLVRVDYRPGHYLQLAPRRVEHNDLNQVKKAQKALRAAELKDDQGESHYRALMHLVGLLRNAVDKPKTVGAQALLDPRHRLQFRVEERDRQSGEVLHDRGGSQGGSGGEKEIIASYVLTASLSYALCPDGLSHPLFGTVVLDEAFSRSSQAFARRIVEALREFNLHPLFVTPNKEMRLLRDHTRSAVLVHRRDTKASTVTLSWEEIDAKTRERKPPQPPSQ